jgi:hypothetical protein
VQIGFGHTASQAAANPQHLYGTNHFVLRTAFCWMSLVGWDWSM